MTRWRAAFLRARLIPLVISLAVVLVAEALQMGALLAWVVASVGIAVLRSRTMVGWRLFGVRKPTPDELEVLRAGISSAQTLRGRREPQLWTAPGDHVFMPTRGDLIISDSWTGYLAEGGDSETVAHLAASTAARSDVTRRTWVVALDTFCLPGRLALAPLVRMGAARPGLKLWMYAWLVLLVGIAVVQQTAMGRWPVAVGLVVLAGACFAGPAWERGWQRCLQGIGSDSRSVAARARPLR